MVIISKSIQIPISFFIDVWLCSVYQYGTLGLTTLPFAYLNYTNARIKCVVRALELNCVENANQRISTHCKIHECS